MPLPVGTKAPDFSLKSKQSSGLVDVKLSNNFGKKNTLLLFFPLAFTSVCTQEMCDITSGLNAYSSLNADVIAVSPAFESAPLSITRAWRTGCGSASPVTTVPDTIAVRF